MGMHKKESMTIRPFLDSGRDDLSQISLYAWTIDQLQHLELTFSTTDDPIYNAVTACIKAEINLLMKANRYADFAPLVSYCKTAILQSAQHPGSENTHSQVNTMISAAFNTIESTIARAEQLRQQPKEQPKKYALQDMNPEELAYMTKQAEHWTQDDEYLYPEGRLEDTVAADIVKQEREEPLLPQASNKSLIRKMGDSVASAASNAVDIAKKTTSSKQALKDVKEQTAWTTFGREKENPSDSENTPSTANESDHKPQQ